MRLKARDPRSKHIKLDTLLIEHVSASSTRAKMLSRRTTRFGSGAGQPAATEGLNADERANHVTMT